MKSAKIVFIKGGANVDDDFHDDGQITARAVSRKCAGTTCICRRDVRGSPPDRRPRLAFSGGGQTEELASVRAGTGAYCLR